MIIRPVTDTLTINSYRLMILTKEILISLEIKELLTALFTTLVKGVKKRKKLITVFKVLLKDITKVLRLKIKKILMEL